MNKYVSAFYGLSMVVSVSLFAQTNTLLQGMSSTVGLPVCNQWKPNANGAFVGRQPVPYAFDYRDCVYLPSRGDMHGDKRGGIGKFPYVLAAAGTAATPAIMSADFSEISVNPLAEGELPEVVEEAAEEASITSEIIGVDGVDVETIMAAGIGATAMVVVVVGALGVIHLWKEFENLGVHRVKYMVTEEGLNFCSGVEEIDFSSDPTRMQNLVKGCRLESGKFYDVLVTTLDRKQNKRVRIFVQ